MGKLWLSRPLTDSKLFANELNEYGINCLIAPVMSIVNSAFEVPSAMPDGILVSSRHACTALSQLPATWRDVPIYSVGHATASLVRELGFQRVTPGGQDMLSLLPHLFENAAKLRQLLYLSGEDITLDVAPRLAENEIHVTRLVVYKAQAASTLLDEVITAMRQGTLTGATFFSKRSALVANQLILEAGLGAAVKSIDAYCLSLNVAEIAGALPWKRILTCHHQTRHAMRDLVVSHGADS